MKILFVINNLYIRGNGLSASARRTIRALREAGQEVRVLAGENPDPDGPQPEYRLKPFHFPIFQPIIDANGFSYAEADTRIIEEAVSWADVVHLQECFVLQRKTIRIAKKLGKPLTATYHLHPENIFCNLGLGRWRWINRLLLRHWRRCYLNHCRYIQCPSENVYDRLRSYHVRSHLEVISNGLVPDACYRPAEPPENYLDPERPLDLLYIGRLSSEKDQKTLLEAMRYSRFAGRIRLHFAGQGPKEKTYRRLAEKLYREGVLKYRPEFGFYDRNEIRRIAARADLCVHCATIEVEGLSIMEAMQQGAVPIIAQGRYSGTAQFALSRRCLFPSRHPEVLAHRIDYWLSHPEQRWEMGWKYAESMKQYHIDLSVEALTRLFARANAGTKNLLNRKNAPKTRAHKDSRG